MKTSHPLLDYLSTCSQTSLESFELARLNDVSNLRQQLTQQITAALDEIVEAEIQARLARWASDRRQASSRSRHLLRRSQLESHLQSEQPLSVARQYATQRVLPLGAERLVCIDKTCLKPRISPPEPRLKLASG